MNSANLFLIKSFHYITTPLGFALLCVVLALVAKVFKFRRLSKWLPIFVISSLLILSSPIVATTLQKTFHQVSGIQDHTENPNLTYDCIMVSGWMKAFPADSHNTRRWWSQRLFVASGEYLKKPVPIIIISSNFPIDKAPIEGEEVWAKTQLLSYGVENKNIVIAKPGRASYEAALYGYEALIEQQCSAVLLVDYPNRLPRKRDSLINIALDKHNTSLLIYTKPALRHEPSDANEGINLRQWLPTTDGLRNSTAVLHEIAGHIAYKLLGFFK